MSKEKISSEYIQMCREKYLTGQHNLSLSQAVVMGSNSCDNIGAAIATALEEEVLSVEEYDYDSSTRRSWRQEHNILILANGRTYMDYIDNIEHVNIEYVIDDTLTYSIKYTQEFVRATIDNGVPKYIVYIGSMAYRSVLNASSVYCAAKAGLAHFMKCMAYELAPKNYNVFCVHPSNTLDTPMTEETIRQIMDYRSINRVQAEDYWSTGLLKNSFLTKQQIADTVLFLVSGKADYLSGSNIEMAGGQR